MTLTVITPPGEPAVPLVDAKTYLRIGHDGEDELVADLVEAATKRLEGASGLALVSRMVERCVSAWPARLNGRGYLLRPQPVRALASVELVDAESTREDITSRFVLSCGRMCMRPWSFLPAIPSGGHVAIRFEAGFGGVADVPGDLELAVKMMVADGYGRGRLDAPIDGRLPDAVANILATRREVRL